MTEKQIKEYTIMNHTADIGIRARGEDMEQAYANAAKGMFSLITDLRKIKNSLSREIAVNAADKETLLVAWLNELIFLFDTEHVLFRKFIFAELSEKELRARAYGEKIDPERHDIKIGIKSTTYHMLRVSHDKNCYQVRVICDI
jgi:SHS2 domain-containing protein